LLATAPVLSSNPSLRTTDSSNYPTDNLYLEMAIIGGIPLNAAWITILARRWRRSRGSGGLLARSCIGLLLGFGASAGSFGLFPGVLFVWTLIFMVPDGGAESQQPAQALPLRSER